MHAAKIDKSDRLMRVLEFLHQRGKAGASTREIIREANVCAVNSIVAEIRANGIIVDCECEGTTEAGGRIYRYRVVEPGQRELFR